MDPTLWADERRRFAVYAAIVAAIRTGHPRRFAVAFALERLLYPNFPKEA